MHQHPQQQDAGHAACVTNLKGGGRDGLMEEAGYKDATVVYWTKAFMISAVPGSNP